MAAGSEPVSICQQLLEEEDQTTRHSLTGRDCHGWTPALLAYQGRHTEIADLFEACDTRDLLERLGAKEGPQTHWTADLGARNDKQIGVSEDVKEAFRRLRRRS